MPLYKVGNLGIEAVEPTSFGKAGLFERTDLQRMLRERVEVVSPEVLVIAEEFGEWEESRRRIDLLGIDKDANLVVIELKRTEDGGHMELQAIRYAAMVSALTTDRAVEIFGRYLRTQNCDEDPKQQLLDFLEWEELDEDRFAQDVRIVLVSADFSRELTTAVMWLNEKDLDIRCVRMKPYEYEGQTLIDVQQVIPLPEATDYQVQVREKKRQERQARNVNIDYTRYDIILDGHNFHNQWKRNAILLVVKRLVQEGIMPSEIERILTPIKGNRIWKVVVGETSNPEEFKSWAIAESEANGKRYDDRRWHTNEGDLFIQDGQTYAFTNQWGGSWLEGMELLKEAFPQIDLNWTPASE
ncbi:MAG: hypothetical protein KC964_26940 [Candidatus Omnitrophica bacterium]|nr:hypothetical protein [Candidatus Omnitrophota bacterium]